MSRAVALAAVLLLLLLAVTAPPLAAAEESAGGEAGKLASAGSAFKSAAANAFGIGSDINGVPVNPAPGATA
uniref:Uncharacterized protein n=1 Tax=Leersia perrieri TaxID=77586 RepID=A0A0D9XEU3_9ORYZ